MGANEASLSLGPRSAHHHLHPILSLSLFFFLMSTDFFFNIKHFISFAKHKNESVTGINVLPILNRMGSPFSLLLEVTKPGKIERMVKESPVPYLIFLAWGKC